MIEAGVAEHKQLKQEPRCANASNCHQIVISCRFSSENEAVSTRIDW